MSDPVAFLRARLDEGEAVALAASPSPWYPKSPDDLRMGDYGWSFGSEPGCLDSLSSEASDSELGKADALHIARFADPATVLADIAMKRSVLEAWEDAGRDPGTEASYAWVLIRDVVIRSWLRQYAGHPEFDPAWLEASRG